MFSFCILHICAHSLFSSLSGCVSGRLVRKTQVPLGVSGRTPCKGSFACKIVGRVGSKVREPPFTLRVTLAIKSQEAVEQSRNHLLGEEPSQPWHRWFPGKRLHYHKGDARHSARSDPLRPRRWLCSPDPLLPPASWAVAPPRWDLSPDLKDKRSPPLPQSQLLDFLLSLL